MGGPLVKAIRLQLNHAASGAHEPRVGHVGAMHTHKDVRLLRRRHAAQQAAHLHLGTAGPQALAGASGVPPAVAPLHQLLGVEQQAVAVPPLEQHTQHALGALGC